jgi:hypothetical protein
VPIAVDTYVAAIAMIIGHSIHWTSTMTLDEAINDLNAALLQAAQTNSGTCNVLTYFNTYVEPLLLPPYQPEVNPPIDAALATFAQQIGILGVAGPIQNELLRRYQDLVFGVFQIQGRDGMVIYSDRVQLGAIGLTLGENATQCKLFSLPAAPPIMSNSSHVAAVRSLSQRLRNA